MDTDSLKTEIRNCHWLFDLFAIGYDFIATRVTPSDIEHKYPNLASLTAELANLRFRDLLVAADGEIPGKILGFVEPAKGWDLATADDLESEGFLTRLLAVLRLIDEVSAGLSYFSFGLSAREWPGVRMFLRDHHNILNLDPRRGVVLKPPPLDTSDWWRAAVAAGWLEPLERGQFHYRLFHNLARVPESIGYELNLKVLESADDAEQTITGPLRVAVIPLVKQMRIRTASAELIPGPLQIVDRPPGEFAVEVGSSGDPASDYAPMVDEIENALPILCAMGMHIILLPELVVPDAILEAVQRVLLSVARGGGPTPFLVLAGTFGRPDARTGKVYNEAVILNGRGNVLFRQRKMHAYTMHGYEQPKYGLRNIFQGQPKTEQMELMPRVLVVCDSPVLGLRMSVLICEDFCQQTPGLQAIRNLRCNLIMSPVMAGALDQNSGFFQTSSQLVLDPEGVVVVANSRALPSQQSCAATDSCSLGIFGTPLFDPTAGSRVHLLTKADSRGFLVFETNH